MSRVDGYLVCGGSWHDFDFARLELLKLFAEDPETRMRVGGDYADVEAIARANFLVTYTCDLRPTRDQQLALRRFVEDGGRWFALHGTNSIFDFKEDGVHSPRELPILMEILGSQFVAHPPISPYTVTVSQPVHPLAQGIERFEVSDELYLSEYHGEVQPILETRFTGSAGGFAEREWPDDEPRLVMYLHRVGSGQVLYLTLGHCRSKYDMQPRIAEYPRTERGAWEVPEFSELLRRGIAWAKAQKEIPA